MRQFSLRFDIRAWWHAGSARGGGLALANMVYKDPDGLPCLPGRSVKGLVRDAMFRAETWGHIAPGRTEAIFGLNTLAKDPELRLTRHHSSPGCVAFGNAELPEMLRHHLKASAGDLAPFFYKALHATAIDASGTAKAESLRGYEVTVPLVLTAPVQVLDDRFQDAWLADFTTCLPLIRGLGMGRNRGLGRCCVALEVAS